MKALHCHSTVPFFPNSVAIGVPSSQRGPWLQSPWCEARFAPLGHLAPVFRIFPMLFDHFLPKGPFYQKHAECCCGPHAARFFPKCCRGSRPGWILVPKTECCCGARPVHFSENVALAHVPFTFPPSWPVPRTLPLHFCSIAPGAPRFCPIKPLLLYV